MRKEKWVLADAARSRALFSLIVRTGREAAPPRDTRLLVRGLRHLPLEAATEASVYIHADTLPWVSQADEMAQSEQKLESEAGRVFLTRSIVMGRFNTTDLFDQLTLSSRLDVAIAVLDAMGDEDETEEQTA